MPSFKNRSSHDAGFTSRKAFTLIELLVVIAIIAILAAILFPVFAQAREKARQTSCLSNCKQMGLAIMMYAQDNDETYPRGWYYGKEYPGNQYDYVTWHGAVQPYVKNGQTNGTGRLTKGLWICPSVSSANGQAFELYGGHSRLMPPPHYGSIPDRLIPSVSLAAVSRPADIAIVSELGAVQNSWGSWSSQDGFVSNWWEHGGSAWPPVFEGESSGSAKFEGDSGTWPSFGMPRYRHSGNANFVFADGHAKAIHKGQLNWCRNIGYAGIDSTWDATDSTWLYGSEDWKPCKGFQP